MEEPERDPYVGNHAVRGGRGQIAVVLLLLALAALTIFPIWAVQYPPLLDYPNHLASSYVLAHLHDVALPFHQWYGAHWGLYPYLAMDVSLHLLQRIAPIELAGRLYLSILVLTLPLSMWFFLRQANPGEDVVAVLALVGVHNIFFLLGYVNFYASLSFCFLALALWLRWLARPRAFAWILAMLAITAVYFSHLIACGVAAIVVATYCLAGRRTLRSWLLSGAMFVPSAVCYLYSARVMEKQSAGFIFLDLSDKLQNLHGIMHGYSDRLDLLTLVAIVVYFFAAWFRNPEFRWNRRWLMVAAILFAIYCALPWAYGDGSDLDMRVLPILFGVILAFARVGRRGWWLAPLALVLFCARVGNITQNFRGVQPELKGLAGSIEFTPRNARVLPIVQADEASDALHHPFAHFWAYGVMRRNWFSPYLFELPGINPLKIVQESYTLDGFWDLNYQETPDWTAIQADYDYVWCYNAPQFAAALEKVGSLVYSDRKLRLYRIHAAVERN